jgi:hypothetical protein
MTLGLQANNDEMQLSWRASSMTFPAKMRTLAGASGAIADELNTD